VKRRATFLLAAVAAATLVVLSSVGPAAAHQGSCPDSNPPDEIVLVAGSSQTAQLGQPLQTNFQVKLANHDGCPLTGSFAGVTVTFDGPDSGPSGIFAGSGWREATVGTDANGVATAPTFTANFTTGAYTVFAHSGYGDVQFSLANTANGVPASITATSGSGQSATISRRYAHPLQAKVVDATGQPVQGASVSFAIVPGAAGAGAAFLAGAQASATTNSDGLATSPPLLANATVGRFAAVASVSGLASVATFALDNHTAAEKLIARKTAPRSATVGTAFRAPLTVRLLDADRQPIEGQAVTFALAAQASATAGASDAGASFMDGMSQAVVVTDAEGFATSPRFTASHTAGAFVATASTPGAPGVGFTLRNKAGHAAFVALGAASGESTTIGTRFTVPLALTVSDRFGNRVSGAIVAFSAPRRGASGYFLVAGKHSASKLSHAKPLTVTAKTNDNGIAVAPPFVANNAVGGYLVRVGVKNSGARGSFALVNTPSS
jgi:hypothetical protein